MSTGVDNRITLHKLEVLCLVVELGGVRRAAEHLFISQPGVTAHLRQLQDRIGAELFVRNGRRIELTQAGERVYAWASETLARTRGLRRELDALADGTRGSVIVAASASVGSYLLPPMLTAFRRSRPRADIVLTVSDAELAVASVARGECDFAVVIAEQVPAAAHVTSELLGHEPVVLVASPDWPPYASSISIAELEALPLVAPSPHIGRPHALERVGQASGGVEPRNIAIELGHPEPTKRAVEDGLGAALLFRSSVARELALGSLRAIALDDVELSVPVFLIRHDRKPLSLLQADLLDAVRARMTIALEQSRITNQEPANVGA